MKELILVEKVGSRQSFGNKIKRLLLQVLLTISIGRDDFVIE